MPFISNFCRLHLRIKMLADGFSLPYIEVVWWILFQVNLIRKRTSSALLPCNSLLSVIVNILWKTVLVNGINDELLISLPPHYPINVYNMCLTQYRKELIDWRETFIINHFFWVIFVNDSPLVGMVCSDRCEAMFMMTSTERNFSLCDGC